MHRLPSPSQCWLLEQAFLLTDKTGKVNQTPCAPGFFLAPEAEGLSLVAEKQPGANGSAS